MRKLKLFFACLLMAVLSIGQVWGAVNNGDLFERISAAPSANDEIIFVKQSNDGACGATNTVGRNRRRVDVTISNDQYIYDSEDGVVAFTVKTNNSGQLGFHDGTGYLYSASNSNNYMGTNTTAASTAPSGTAAWSSSVSSSVFTLSNATNTNYYLGFNTSSALFAQYKTGQSKPYIYKKVMSAPTAVTASDITSSGVTITITDATNVNNYELYYGTSSTAPTAGSTATTTITSGKSKSLTGLEANTTYYVWARAYSTSPARKTGWVALTGSSFKTTSAAPAYTITEASNNPSYGTVSLDGSIITGSPAACCEYANPAYTVSPNGKATVTQGTGEHINEFTISNLSDNVTVTICFKEKAAGKTVNFDAGPGIPASVSLTEECAGAGVTLPSVDVSGLCKGWGTFAGWATAAVNDSNTTSVTVYTAESNYEPATDNMTLYAVYSKVKSGSGTAFQYTLVTEAPSDWSGQYLLSTGTVTATGYDNSNHFSSASLTPGTTEYASYEFTLTKVGTVGYSIMEPSGQYVGWSSGTAFIRTTTAPTASNTSYLWTPATDGYISNVNTPARQIAYNGSSDFRPYSNPSSGATYLYKRAEGAASVTYYVSDPDCCTPHNVNIAAGVTNGSVSADPASACEGATVTLTFTPNSNYHLSGWTLNGTAQDIAENTFTMPAAAVTISATFDTDDLPTYTANWYVNGTKVHNQTDIEGATLTNIPSDFSSVADCSDLTFRGWLTAPLASVSATKPVDLIESTTGMTMPNGGANYYAVFAEATPSLTPGNVDYDHTISAKTWTADGEQTLSSVAWTLDNGSDFYGYDATKGQQMGSGSDAATSASLSTSGISGTINSVTIYTSGANSIAGSVSVSVNGEDYTTTGSATSASLTSSNAGYTFSGSEEGDIVISWSQTSSKAMYFKRIVVNHVEMIAGVSYSNYVTSCPHCTSVTLNNSSVEHGTIALQVNSADVSVVKTCNDASVNVVASPETGYELTDVALSGVDGATYSAGVISIPKDKEGTLQVTATFEQTDYVVALAQSPAVGADLTGGKNDAHYGETINISTTVPSNAFFVNWTSDDVTITNPTSATGASFTMPAKDVTVTANFTEVHNVAWAIANTPSSGTLAGVYVKGIVKANPIVETGYKNATYYICDLDANGEPANEFYVYRGKNVGNTDFTNVNQLTEGDEVIIYGTLKTYSSVKEFDAGNYIIANGRTAASISSVEVSGDADKTEYFAGETFEYAGLSARAIYNTGYQKNVTPTWEANTEASYIVSTSETINVTATYGGKTSANYPVAVEVTTKVLESIDVTPAAMTGYKGVALPKPTTVTAHFDDGGIKSTQNVAALAIYDEAGDYDATSTAEQTIQVKYTFGLNTRTANYTVTLSSIVNTIDAAYSVEKAQEIVDIDRAEGNNLDLANTDNKVYVTGVVTSISGSSPYTIQIKDNTADETFLELYKCTFNGVTSVEVGDIIKAYGNLEWYPSLSKYELSEGGQVVWKQQIAVTGVTLADEQDAVTLKEGKTIQLEATVAPANAGNKSLSWESSDPSVASVDDNGLVTAEAIGTATITVTTEEGGFTATCAVTVIDASTRTTGNAVFQKVTAGPITDGQYLIVCASELVAFDGGLTDLDISSNTIAITIDGGLIVAPEDASFTINASTGSIKSYSNKYIGNGSNSNALSVSDDPLTNTLSIDASENFVVVSAGGAYLRYNKSPGQERFKYFKSGTYTAQQAIQLYKKVEPEEIRGNLSDGKWGTICPAKKVLVPAGASFYKLNYMELNSDGSPYKFFFDEIGENAYLEAGKPYLFIAEGTTITGVKVGDAADDGLHVHNGFVGYLGSGNYDLSSDYDVYTAGANNYYGLQNNIFKLIYGTSSYMINERAFVQITPTSKPATTEQPAPAYSRRRLVVGAGAPQVTTGTENIEASETPVKVMIDGQLFILRGEKMYDATGRLVK